MAAPSNRSRAEAGGRRRRRASGPGVALCLAALAGPAFARQPGIPPDVDRLMWCASAFFWLAGSADDAGEAGEAELYDGWANALTERGSAMLAAAGFDAAGTEQAIADYDQLVLDEIAGETPRYDVAACAELVAG